MKLVIKLLPPVVAALAVCLPSTGCGSKDSESDLPVGPARQTTGINLTAQTPATTTAGAPASPTVPAAPTDAENAAAASDSPEMDDSVTLDESDPMVSVIQEAANNFYNDYKRMPASPRELVKQGYLVNSPALQAKRYIIEPKTGRVSAAKP